MTARNPALWMQGRTDHTAEQERALLDAVFSGSTGVVRTGGLAVTQSGTPAMSVSVAAGKAVVAGTETANQGSYLVWNDAAETVTIAAADATNPRRDIIVARIKDAFYSGADNTFTIESITGTPAASPADPAVPSNCLPLARVAVAASATSITNANITSLRTLLRPWNTAWGLLGYVVKASSQTGITTVADISGATLTWDSVSGRLYRVGISGLMEHTLDGAAGQVLITDAAGANDLRVGEFTAAAASGRSTLAGSVIIAGTGSSITRKARANRVGASGSISVIASSTVPWTMYVEDIGPAPA